MPQTPPMITWAPWIRDPQYEGEENMLCQQFRDIAPQQQEVGMKMMSLALGNIILPKEKGGLRESIPGQVDQKSRVPEE